MKNYLFISIICALPLLTFGQNKDDIAVAKMMYSIYSMSKGNSGSISESLKSNSKIPNAAPVKEVEIETCIKNFTSQLSAQLENYSSNVNVNNEKEPSFFQIKITSSLYQCPNLNDIQFTADWNYVKNESDANILTKDIEKINKINDSPVDFQKLDYALPVDYKEGDSKPSKVNGSLTLTIPTQLKIVALSSKDINKEINLGTTTIKLLELKGDAYKMLWSEFNPMIKLVAVNEKDAEFAMNMGRNFPTFYFDEFSKKENLTDEDFTRIAKSFDKNDKRITRLSTVSGKISKIYIYWVESTIIRKVNVDLNINH